MNYSKIKDKIHDASGITNPYFYDWEKWNGVYYPAGVKKFKCYWEPPEYDLRTEEVDSSFFSPKNGYTEEETQKAMKVQPGNFKYIAYGHFIIRIK